MVFGLEYKITTTDPTLTMSKIPSVAREASCVLGGVDQ